jgi:uncharacterized RDD family membrane protein YckC
MNHHRTQRLTIKTPEGIQFSLRLAGPVTRFLAWGMDTCCILLVASLIRPFIHLLGVISLDFSAGVYIYAYFVISIGYGILLEWRWHGQTLGKRLFRLRVMDEQGLHLHFSQVVIRNLLRFVDSLPVCYLVGGLASLINRKAQRLGDYAANTIVVWTPRVPAPDFDKILSEKYNSFKGHPHIEARLRQRVSPAQGGVALQALLRRDELDPSARVALFRELAAGFKTLVSFPEDATEGLSDEQYIRNVVSSVFVSSLSRKR